MLSHRHSSHFHLDMLYDIWEIVWRNLSAPARADALRAVNQQERNHGDKVLRLHLNTFKNYYH